MAVNKAQRQCTRIKGTKVEGADTDKHQRMRKQQSRQQVSRNIIEGKGTNQDMERGSAQIKTGTCTNNK